MARRHILPFGLLLLVLGAVTSAASSCSSSTQRDINFGTDAGAGFEIPMRETAPDTTGGTGGEGGTGGDGGGGGQGGAGGDATSDAATD
jgi:hypothetical protein